VSNVVTNQNIDENLLLGYLYFYKLGSVQLELNELIGLFKQNNIDTKFIKPLTNSDAFKRSISKCTKNIKLIYNNQESKAKLEFDNITGSKGNVVKLMSRKIINAVDEDISFETVGKIIFSKSQYKIDKNINANILHEYNYYDVVDEIEENYNDSMKYYYKENIRQIVQNIIKFLYPVDLLSSGLCKFIPKAEKELLFNLQQLIFDLNSYGEDCEFEVIPIADTQETRELVNKALEEDLKKEIEEFIDDVSEKLSSKRKLSAKIVASYIEKFKYLQQMIQAYEGNLDVGLVELKEKVVEMTELVSQNEE
jgi:hypothetical protein